MSTARIRIYSGPNPEQSNFVGLSATSTGLEKTRGWAEFFSERGYEAVEKDLEGSHSYVNMEVRPPMSEQHIREFAQMVDRCLTWANNGMVVIDNRAYMPRQALETGGPIILTSYS